MPSGVYVRKPSAARDAVIKQNLAKGRTKEVQARAAQTRKKIVAGAEWREKVAEATKAALNKNDTRRKHLEGIAAKYGQEFKGTVGAEPTEISEALGIHQDYINRFWTKVEIKGRGECWPYKKAPSCHYGRFWNGKEEIVAHRFALSIHLCRNLKPYPEERAIHHCHNPACCNPNHLAIKRRTRKRVS